MISNLYNNFLGSSANWYKNLIITFLFSNPIIYFILLNTNLDAGFILGWIILGQFIVTLAMALECYPLQPGGLIAIQSVILGLTTSKHVYQSCIKFKSNLVASFYSGWYLFHERFLLFIFTKLLINVKIKSFYRYYSL